MIDSIKVSIQGGKTVGATAKPPYRYGHLQPCETIQAVLRGIGPLRPVGLHQDVPCLMTDSQVSPETLSMALGRCLENDFNSGSLTKLLRPNAVPRTGSSMALSGSKALNGYMALSGSTAPSESPGAQRVHNGVVATSADRRAWHSSIVAGSRRCPGPFPRQGSGRGP